MLSILKFLSAGAILVGFIYKEFIKVELPLDYWVVALIMVTAIALYEIRKSK